MCLHLVVMDRVDQQMLVALGCCTITNWWAATISVCVAYVVGLSTSWRLCSTLWYSDVFKENQNIDVLLVYPRRNKS